MREKRLKCQDQNADTEKNTYRRVPMCSLSAEQQLGLTSAGIRRDPSLGVLFRARTINISGGNNFMSCKVS